MVRHGLAVRLQARNNQYRPEVVSGSCGELIA
jgi:hypothetical protein